ncbi:triose-phosphate isomerase [Gottschalkiaceae bacterium SANA]|nr:triose-phosphate isomerase [Gottschalkiaceae bacterium SANA]
MRIPIIAGNWKMNKTIAEGVALVNGFKAEAANTDVEVVVCVPYVMLPAVKEALAGSKVKIGAQNMHWEEGGAYTGEISPLMLNELGIDYVVIGHSERREYFAETNETVNKKVKSAFAHNLLPIMCCGETLAQREANEHKTLVAEQIRAGIEGLSIEEMSKLVIAYEPIWAIGTGVTATSDQANEMCEMIRDTVAGIYNDEIAEVVRIQYGGSVKPANVTEIMNQPHIDGALVGGASLKADDFTALINF